MTADVSWEVLNRRTTVATVQAEAARIGADADTLLDSKTFYEQVTRLDPDAPGYLRQVQEMVAVAAGKTRAAAQSAPGQPPGTAGSRQWTIEDVERSTPAELETAMKAGLLLDLGVGAPRRKRGQRP